MTMTKKLMKPAIDFKFKLITWLLHLAGLVLCFFALSWIQSQLTALSNEWISHIFIVFGALYLSAVTMRIYNAAHPAPRLLQQHFGTNNE